MTRLLALAAATAAAFASMPAAAQEQAGDRVNTVIVYGDDDCPQSSDTEIVVCARMDESERYRIPEALRQSSSPENEPWANKVRAYETVGNFGALSCSPAGAGGELGDEFVGDREGFIARPAKFYRKAFAEAGFTACGSHGYLSRGLREEASALELGATA